MTYSVYDIKVDNNLAFSGGITAGYVLSINSNGSTTWVAPSTGTAAGMVVDFSASSQSFTAGLTVSFSNLSSPTPLFNFWEFGDSSFSTASAPTKRYNAPGTFSVKLNACNTNSGGIATKLNYISVATKYLLNEYPGATASFSTRLLRTGYTGSCMRVRRSSDNTEQDIGFLNSELDTTSLLSFVGVNSGFIRTWYDQSGLGNNAQQTAIGAQPRIVNAGVLETLNGRPSPFWVNASNPKLIVNPFTQSQPATFFIVSKLTAASGIDASVIYDSQNTGGRMLLFHTGTTELPNNTLRYHAGTSINVESSFSNIRLITTLHQGTYSVARTQGVERVSGAANSPGTNSLSGLSMGGLQGVDNQLYNFSGHIAEFVLYPSNKSADFLGIEGIINEWWTVY